MSLSFIADTLQITQPLLSLIKSLYNWWNFILPAQKVLGPASKNDSELVVFVRDFFVAPGTQLLVREGINIDIDITNSSTLSSDVQYTTKDGYDFKLCDFKYVNGIHTQGILGT